MQSLGVRRVGVWSAQGERLRIQDSGHHAHPDRACSAGANTCLSTLALGYLQSPPFIFGFFLLLGVDEGGELEVYLNMAT